MSNTIEISPEGITEARRQMRWKIPGRTPAAGLDPLIRVLGRCVIVGDCWEWQGKGDKGYGRISVGDRAGTDPPGTRRPARPAHRFIWEAVHGPITDSAFYVCHTCDNPPCVNPAHLFLGTAADNNRDRHRKGRTVLPDPAVGGLANRGRTHCQRGHGFTPENTYVRSNGQRTCRACVRLHKRDWQAERRRRLELFVAREAVTS